MMGGDANSSMDILSESSFVVGNQAETTSPSPLSETEARKSKLGVKAEACYEQLSQLLDELCHQVTIS